MTTLIPGRRGVRNLLLSAAVLGGAAFAAAPASAGVTLDWTTENAYRSGCTTPAVNCTWLGYTTNSPAPQGANGTATPSNGATGPTVTPQSARGAGQSVTWRFPATSGSLDVTNPVGEMSFRGTVTFASPAPPAGHGFTISVENPRIVLDAGGTTGHLYASGLKSDGTYDQSQPVFDLAVTPSSTLSFDGTRTYTLLDPAITVAGYAFPANYLAGWGPNRTPNIFGSFTLAVTPDTGAKGADGTNGTNGRDGTNGTNGRDGTNGKDGKNGTTTVVRVQTSSLAKAPFSGKAAHKVRITARRSSKTLATGTVKGRSITFTLAKGVNKKSLKGTYVLHLVKGRGAATVSLP